MHNLARYRVVRRLGAGAAGGVYLVEDRVLGGPPVALKRVEHASSPELRDSFAREFAVLASLSLPGVAHVHDLGVMPASEEFAGGPFFTRDFVDGEPLDGWSVGRAPERLLDLFLSVLRVLALLHRRGVVHGDLKPANIIIDTAGAPHLIDFGLASRAADRLSGTGTPLFMAPELLAGGPASMAGDIYALAATFWSALVGDAPHAQLAGRMLHARLRGELPAIPDGLDPGRRVLLDALLWALAADPQARAPSADELAARLERAHGRASSSERGPFVAPRPRGREQLVDELFDRAIRGAGAAVQLLHGARGMGKSSVLTELKWRLQLAEARVLEVHARDAVLAPTAQLARQLAVSSEASARLLREAGEPNVQALAAALTPEGEKPYVLLIDDLEHAGAVVEILRAAQLRTESGSHTQAPVVIATCESLSASVPASIIDVDAIALPPIDDGALSLIVAEVLGPLERGREEALLGHAAGNPGVLLEALRWLWERRDFTASELHALAPGAIARGRAASRVEALSREAMELATLLAIVRAPLAGELLDGLGFAASARAELLGAGLVREQAGAWLASEPAVADHLRTQQDGGVALQVARRVLAESAHTLQLDVVARAELSLSARDGEALSAVLGPALTALRTRGATQRGVHLAEAARRDALLTPPLALLLSELYVEVGECMRACELAESLLGEGGLDDAENLRARIAAARGYVASGNLDRAADLLTSLSDAAPATLLAQAARELARVHLRRGAHDRAMEAVERGLNVAVQEPSRAELLAISATLRDHAGDGEGADRAYDEALTLARKLGAVREEALVLGYRAMSYERRGALDDARADYEAGLAAARHAGDLGLTATYASNLGNVSFRSGHLDGVEQHYTLAAGLARRAGRTNQALLADTNLANLHLHLGSFARARVLAEAVLGEAQRLDMQHAEAHALQILAEVDARTGEREAALARSEAATARFAKVGRTIHVAESHLDSAEILLDRGGVSDFSAASARLAQARDVIERHRHEDLRPRLRLLLARARAGNGDPEGALRDLTELERTLPKQVDRELTWQLFAAQAELHRQLGANLLATRKAREAAELIELLASQVPRDARDAYLADPRRRAMRQLAKPELDSGRREAGNELLLSEPRFARLLELIKRLARERDLDRLLERITDAAVDLSGAERGFVLLVDERGQLAPHTVRASGGAESDPMVAFSRSIAEAVLIDGEPIVTVNARDDHRLNEFMSVHKLMLKSVACIPISGPRGVVGVLYLEHRLRAGRFQESEIDLLLAFADQAAIAIENARLWSENERRQRELAAQADELARAKADIERLLATRTEELEQVRRDLGRARAELEEKSARHGIVGQGPAMRRVFALIDRVADSPVPVVIEGESGTGKELVARAIHFHSGRKKEPFVAINCAALPEQLLESELFGHVRGAFTGADRDKRGLFMQAQGGTIFLDEFADVPPRMQVDLLRVLQERCIRPVGAEHDVPIDVRVIVATNRPLKQLVASGRVREDLYYRLSVVEIRLPALRERSEDIPMLCDHLLARLAERSGGRPRKLSRAALERIMQSELPGNVRQLEHLLTSAAMMAEGVLIEPVDLGLDEREESVELPATSGDELGDDMLPSDLSGFKTREKQRILDALEKHNWNRAKAATALGMPRRTFYRRLTEFNIL